MRRVVVCPTDFLFRLFQGTPGNSDSWVFLVNTNMAAATGAYGR